MLGLKPPQQNIVSANPLALATLTMKRKNGQQELVEWTDVKKIRWKLNGREYIRHVLEPILKEHLGAPAWLKGATGLGLGLQSYDEGCRLVVDVPLAPLPGESQYDMHVEG
jgi:hypothetical protein